MNTVAAATTTQSFDAIIMASRRQSLLSGPFSFSGALSERSFNNNNQSPL
jgi:hypothetical protein